MNAGTAPQVARIDLEAGDIHMLLDVSGRNGGIAVDANLAEGGTYRIVNPSVDSASDARMGFMRGYWAQVGFAPPVMLLQRTAPLEVVGQLSERSEAVGREFSPSKGPLTTLTTNCFVVRGMNGDVAVVTEKDMGRMFTHLTDINGKRIKNLHK